MNSVFAALVLGQSRFREENALRTVLPNDAVIYVQELAAPTVSFQVFVANANTPDSPATYGYRHLLEHIIARSLPGHDLIIESAGGALDAQTTRDYVKFEWNLPPEKVGLAVSAMRRFLDWKSVTKEEIARESAIIGHEVDLQEASAIEAKEAWDAIFEEQGLSMIGDSASCSKATPEQLTTLWKKMVIGSQIVVSVAGPVDKNALSLEVKKEIQGYPKGTQKQWASRSISGSYGTKKSAAIVVPPIGTPGSISSLVAAFGASGRLSRSFAVLGPSARPSVALIGTSDPAEEIAKELKDEDPATAFRFGKSYLYAWIQSNLATPSKSANFYGQLFTAGLSQHPRKLWEQVEYADYSQFLNYWRQIQAVAK